MYVGNSTKHGESIPLLLDLETGKITPQYHLVFDDEFQTVDASDKNQINFEHDNWYQTFGLIPSQFVPDDIDMDGEPSVPKQTVESEGVSQQERLRLVRDQLDDNLEAARAAS